MPDILDLDLAAPFPFLTILAGMDFDEDGPGLWFYKVVINYDETTQTTFHVAIGSDDVEDVEAYVKAILSTSQLSPLPSFVISRMDKEEYWTQEPRTRIAVLAVHPKFKNITGKEMVVGDLMKFLSHLPANTPIIARNGAPILLAELLPLGCVRLEI